MAHRRVAGEQWNDDDRGIGRQKVAFDKDHGDTLVFRNIKAGQGFQEEPPGAVIMSASGCP